MATAIRGSGFGILWHSIVTPYEEEWRMYSKMVEVREPRNFGSGIINGLNGFAMANGVKTNLFEAAVRYNYSDFRRWHQFRLLDKTSREIRLNEVLSDVGTKYLKTATVTGKFIGWGSLGATAVEGLNYYLAGGTDWKVYAKIGFDMTMSLIGMYLEPIGLAVSTTYFVLDVSTGGFGLMH